MVYSRLIDLTGFPVCGSTIGMNDSATLMHQFDRRLIDSLYTEAMVLADEARGFFDYRAEENRAALGKIERVEFSCESLKVTTRLMHVIAWLLAQRASFTGELSEAVRHDPRYRLGEAAPSLDGAIAHFSGDMLALIDASEDLYDRVARLEGQLVGRSRGVHGGILSPARDLLAQLERAL